MAEPAATGRAERWYHSLIARVVLLCSVLVLCLLGSVYIITHHYFHQVAQEMESRTREMVDNLVLQVAQNPNVDYGELEEGLRERYRDFDEIQVGAAGVDPGQAAIGLSHVTVEMRNGRLAKVARIYFPLGEDVVELTARVSLNSPGEVLRVFRNKYLAAVTAVFVATLALMLYFIAKLLRPLRELSEACARIGQGDLQDVGVRKNSREILALERTFNRMVSALREKEVVEANLRQAQRLSAIGTLAAGIAHDVRNPLNAIKLLSSHALDSLDNGPDREPAAKHLRTIRNEVDRLEDIVSRFLSLAKERELQFEPCRPDDLLNECLRLVKQDAEARGVLLATELRAGDTTLMLDPKQWTRAVLNVLLNALEACPAGGRVRLFSRVTDLGCEIEIRDDGPGMPKEVAERAFDPYFTTKSSGTGLGLSITRGIIEEHGGTVELSTSEGQGCQVLITMSLAVGDAHPPLSEVPAE